MSSPERLRQSALMQKDFKSVIMWLLIPYPVADCAMLVGWEDKMFVKLFPS